MSTIETCRQQALAVAQDALLQEVPAWGCVELAVAEFTRALFDHGLLPAAVETAGHQEIRTGDAT